MKTTHQLKTNHKIKKSVFCFLLLSMSLFLSCGRNKPILPTTANPTPENLTIDDVQNNPISTTVNPTGTAPVSSTAIPSASPSSTASPSSSAGIAVPNSIDTLGQSSSYQATAPAQRSAYVFANPYTYSELTVANPTAVDQVISVSMAARGGEQINSQYVKHTFGLCNWDGGSCYSWNYPVGNKGFVCEMTQYGFTCAHSGYPRYRTQMVCNSDYSSCSSGTVTIPAHSQLVFSFGSVINMDKGYYGFQAKNFGVVGAGTDISIVANSSGTDLTAKLEQFDDYSNIGQTILIPYAF